MIKILIVEDSSYKLQSILQMLNEDQLVNANNIHTATDIKKAKQLLKRNHYDLLILDLVLPINDGENPTPDNGIRFLNDIHSNDAINSPIHIIGLTEFDDLVNEFDDNFQSYLWHLINYKAGEINWKEKLKKLINHLISVRERFHNAYEKRMFDVAILCALNLIEFEAIMDLAIWNKFEIPNDPTIYYSAEIKKSGSNGVLRVVAACANQMGMTGCATLVSKLCLHFEPRYVFITGICAGIKSKGVNFGDILIAEQTWDYGSGKMIEKSNEELKDNSLVFEPDPRPIQLHAELKSKVNAFLRGDICSSIQSKWKGSKTTFLLKAMIGPIASGSYVISSDAILSDIISHNRKLLGVEMEAYGVYYAAENILSKTIKPIMIKSVCDFGDSQKNDDNQRYAAYTSAAFAWNFICSEIE